MWSWLMVLWYDFRIWLLVQRIRVWGTLRGKPSLWGYSWRLIAASACQRKLSGDRSRGVEPSSKDIDLVRGLVDRAKS